MAAGVGVEAADGAVADAPLGHVEHPLDADLVGRVDHRLQVGQRVLDLAPVVEAGAARRPCTGCPTRMSCSSMTRLWALVR